jgi:uncharacterized membrane protein
VENTRRFKGEFSVISAMIVLLGVLLFTIHYKNDLPEPNTFYLIYIIPSMLILSAIIFHYLLFHVQSSYYLFPGIIIFSLTVIMTERNILVNPVHYVFSEP